MKTPPSIGTKATVGTALLVAASFLALAPATQADHLPGSGQDAVVSMSVLTGFDPKINEISTGSVTFFNGDGGTPHRPAEEPGATLGAACFDTGVMVPGSASATRTVSLADCGDTIAYRCLIHPWMVGLLLKE